MRDSWHGLCPRQLSRDRNLELNSTTENVDLSAGTGAQIT